jgi:predicted metal-dependent hydrolase
VSPTWFEPPCAAPADVAEWPYVVRRSDLARRARLTVTGAGEVVVVLPRRAPLAEAERLVMHHDAWIARHVDRLQAERARLEARPPIDAGRVLEVGGRPMVVVLVAADLPPARGSVRIVGERLVVRVGRDGRSPACLLERWLRARARQAISQRVAVRSVEMRVAPGRLSIRDQSSRWASASASGALSFSWRLILAPPDVLDAVVVHELAHLRVRGHSRAFWELVERHAPQTRDARRWLRAHAREVRAALE